MTDLRKAAIELLKSAGDHVTGHWPELDDVVKALAQPEHTSSTIQRAEFVVSNLRQRNEKTWDELDREAVFAINGLVEFAKFQFNRANAALRQALEQPDMGIDRGAWDDVPDATKWVDELRGGDETEQEPVAYLDAVDSKTVYVAPNRKRWLDPHEDKEWLQFHYDHPHDTPLYTAPVSKPDDLLRQSEQEGWRWAKECEAEVKRLRTLLAEGGQGCGECGVKASDGYALYCVKCVLPMKEWIGLTDEERSDVIGDIFGNIFAAPQKSLSLARAIEAKLKEKNNG